jgi:hypothetical protein
LVTFRFYKYSDLSKVATERTGVSQKVECLTERPVYSEWCSFRGFVPRMSCDLQLGSI